MSSYHKKIQVKQLPITLSKKKQKLNIAQYNSSNIKQFTSSPEAQSSCKSHDGDTHCKKVPVQNNNSLAMKPHVS